MNEWMNGSPTRFAFFLVVADTRSIGYLLTVWTSTDARLPELVKSTGTTILLVSAIRFDS